MTTPHRRAHRLMNAGVVWSISRTTRATTRGPGTGSASGTRATTAGQPGVHRGELGVDRVPVDDPLVGCVREGQFQDVSADCDPAAHATHSPMADAFSRRQSLAIGNSALRAETRRSGRSRLDSRDVRSAPWAIEAHSLSVCGPLDGWPHRSATSTALVHRNGATVPPLHAIGAEARLDAQIDAPLLSRDSERLGQAATRSLRTKLGSRPAVSGGAAQLPRSRCLDRRWRSLLATSATVSGSDLAETRLPSLLARGSSA